MERCGKSAPVGSRVSDAVNSIRSNTGMGAIGLGANFIFELLFNAVLSPVIVRLIRIGKKEVE